MAADLRGHPRAVGPAGDDAVGGTHHLAHVLHAGGAGTGDGVGDDGGEVGVLELGRQVVGEHAALVADVITTTGATGIKDMGRVMGAAQAAVAGRADGSRVAAEVRRQLG